MTLAPVSLKARKVPIKVSFQRESGVGRVTTGRRPTATGTTDRVAPSKAAAPIVATRSAWGPDPARRRGLTI
ncbi:hypothetical protein GCM10020216_092100 [Nonomuraea helvata]